MRFQNRPNFGGKKIRDSQYAAIGSRKSYVALRTFAGTNPKTIDVTIEYLRPGRAMTTYARADVRKVGRQIANVHVEAWQEARAKPVAALRGHFLLSAS